MRTMCDVPIKQIRPNPRNVRTHSKKQIRQIANSIREFGFQSPLLIDEDRVILAGHGRWAAAEVLGLATVPAIVISNLSEAKKRALAIADNRLAESSKFDRELLSIELPQVIEALRSEEVDVSVLGFEPTEIDQLEVDFAVEKAAEEEPPIRLRERTVSRRGDHWHLGNHRLMCGDARDAAAMRGLMGSERASMVFTDPPFNVKNPRYCWPGKSSSRRVCHGERRDDVR